MGVASIASLALAGCDDDLGNGYTFVRLDGFNHVITEPSSIILVDTNVTFYDVRGDIVVGLREVSVYPPYAWFPEDQLTLGYFVIETETRHSWLGLRRGELAELLTGIAGSTEASAFMEALPQPRAGVDY